MNMAKAVLGNKCLLFPSYFARATFPSLRQASTETDYGHNVPKISTDTSQYKRGTGGRSSFSGKVVTVFGASGFLGRAVINKLGKMGCQVIVAYRGDVYFVHRLKVCGDLGQILFQHFSLKDEDSLRRAMKYSNVVVNLIGKNHETKNFPFEEVHVKGARSIAKIARESGVETLIHVSALNATEKPTPVIFKKGSQFLASKWRGEQAVQEEFPDAVIFRPSDMYGPNDRFCCYYGSWFRHTFRFISLWKRGENVIKQPVFFSDVAQGIQNAIQEGKYGGQTFQAVGPCRFELGELIDWFHRVMMKTPDSFWYRTDLRFDPIMWLKIWGSEKLFKDALFSYERIERDHITDFVDPDLPTLEDLGVKLTYLQDRVFFELKRFRAHAYHDPTMETYFREVEPPRIVTY